jgi:hypothetical protein
MTAVLGLVAAGRGDVVAARSTLLEVTRIDPGCHLIPALELSLPVAEAGGVDAYWRARPGTL